MNKSKQMDIFYSKLCQIIGLCFQSTECWIPPDITSKWRNILDYMNEEENEK